MDVFNTEQRSAVMRSVKSKNTSPEIKVRRLLHRAGYRYRIHRTNLPGKPDIVFASRRAAIFIHGCFWHQHPGCPHATRPSSNNAYWTRKLNRNIERDKDHIEALQELRWRVLTIWECEIRRSDILAIVKKFLESQ